MGLGYAELTQNNPELLYFSLRGFAGKNASRPGHDLNFVAASGCGEWFLENGPNYACHWGDIVGGTLVPLTKLLAHLSNPDRRGMQLVSYMDEGFRSLFLDRAYDMVKAESLPHADRTRYGTHHFFNGTQPHSQYYRCEDGAWVALNAVQQKHWDTFCDGVGKPEWKEKQTDKNLSAEVTALFQGQPASYWEALFAGKEVCLFKVLSWEEHLMESASRLQILRDPLNWAGFAPHALGPTPALGEDTFSVVQELGIGVATFGQYMKEGIIYQPEAPGRTSK
jgi:crotonobetainyl-CoA:carnitine CoA-transferase CaiB-like acyl-CoA transferase